MPVKPPDVRALQDFMRARFRKPRPSRVLRLLGEPPEWDYSLGALAEMIERVEDGGFFRKHGVFRVYVRDWFLEHPVLPGRGSFGLFSHDGERLRYLSASDPGGLEETLRAEARPLGEADPGALGSLFCEALLDRHARSHHLIRNERQLLGYGHEGTPFVYRVDRREIDRVAGRIRAPAITGGAAGGWRLEFTTVYGRLHEKQDLGAERFDIDGHFRINRKERQVLSRRIFARTPDVLY